MPTLYLIRGIPGSGKSDLAQQLYRCGVVHAVFEADNYFVRRDGSYQFDAGRIGEAHEWCQERVWTNLSSGLSVAVSNTSTTEKEVQIYQEMAKQNNAKFVSLIVENRHEGVNVHGVPDEKLQQMKNRFSVKL